MQQAPQRNFPSSLIVLSLHSIFQLTNSFPRYYLKAVLVFNEHLVRGPALQAFSAKTYEGSTVISRIVIKDLSP